MADRGEDDDEAKLPLFRLESGTSKSVKSSKADEGLDEGLGDGSRDSGLRNNCGDDCLELEITIALCVNRRSDLSPPGSPCWRNSGCCSSMGALKSPRP